MTDRRRTALQAWAHSLPGSGDAPLEMVSGDASFRRYFRLQRSADSVIAVDAPPEQEDSRRFVAVAGLLAGAGVKVPEVLATDYEQGFLLLSDLGDRLYLDSLERHREADHETVDRLYREAIDSLVAIQAGVDGERLDPYDRQELRREMALFDEWFLGELLHVPLDAACRALISDCYEFLEDAALAQPQVAVHRDYHSRNLMRVETGGAGPGIIDFQDALRGPYSYDLVSLLRDCYISWPEPRLREWLSHYQQRAREAGVVELPAQQLRRDFDLMGLQRHLKVMGIFARLAIRDKKPRYLADIPLVIRYFLDVASGYPELAAFSNWFHKAVLPEATSRLGAI